MSKTEISETIFVDWNAGSIMLIMATVKSICVVLPIIISLTTAFSQRFFLTMSHNVFITMAFSQRLSHNVFLTTFLSHNVFLTSFWQPFLTTFLCS